MLELMKVPENFEDAVNTIVEFIKQDEVFMLLVEKKSIDILLGITHHSLGRDLRNTWGLWSLWSSEDSVNPLVKDFNLKGIFHADDMSGIILTAALSRLKNIKFDFDEKAKEYWRHWIKYDIDGLGKRVKEFLGKEKLKSLGLL